MKSTGLNLEPRNSSCFVYHEPGADVNMLEWFGALFEKTKITASAIVTAPMRMTD